MAGPDRRPHASPVGRPQHPRGGRAEQEDLFGDDARDEDAAPGLTVEVMQSRRQDATARAREALGACPEGFEPEEWAVVVATLAPDVDLGRIRGGSSRGARASQARRCFPGLSAPAALRAWLDVSSRPHVVQVVADLRAIEVVDILAQRDTIREVLTNVMLLGMDVLDLRAVDPSGAGKCGAAAVAAAKALAEFDGLRAPKPGEGSDVLTTGASGPTGSGSKLAEDPLAALAAKVSLVAENLARRLPAADVL